MYSFTLPSRSLVITKKNYFNPKYIGLRTGTTIPFATRKPTDIRNRFQLNCAQRKSYFMIKL